MIRFLLIAALAAINPILSAAPSTAVKHVVVIGVDGLSPEGIQISDTPVIDALVERGAHTWHGRAVMPTSSSPNWKSMVSGAGPEQHGVTSNKWELDNYTIAPTATGAGGLFPTIFGVLREQQPAAHIALFHDWKGFARLVETEACDIVVNPPGEKTNSVAAFAAAEQSAAYFREHQPRFLFVHLDHVDHAGHQHGWSSEPYIYAVRETDIMVDRILRAIRDVGAEENTIVLLTADHGGLETKHGGESMAELEIPWIIAGPGIKQGHEIKSPVNTYDTAATLAKILGVTPPQAWIAKPVEDGFEE